jgi:hypothetical protein
VYSPLHFFGHTFPYNFRAHHKSEWYEHINFVVTQFTSFLNDRPKNFTHRECKDYFSHNASRPRTQINYDVALSSPVDIFGITALLAACAVLFTLSVLTLLAEVVLSTVLHHRVGVNQFILRPKIIHFSCEYKCAKHIPVIDRFNHLQRCFLRENGVLIINCEASANIRGDAFGMRFALDLQLNAPEKEPVIKEELQAFMFYLDAISLD